MHQLLQSVIDNILQLRGELPREVEALEEEIAQMKVKSAEISALVEQLNRNIADAKLAIADHESTIEKYQRQLEAITNSREYDSLNKEIENQDLLRQIEEKKITDTKAAILEHRGRLEEIKDKLSILSEDLKAKKAELDVIVESFNTITPQRLVEIASNRKLIICEHCGRIIINADVNQ